MTWRTKAGVIKFFKLHSTQVAKILVTESVNILPETETFLSTHTDYPLYDKNHMLEPSNSSHKRGLLVAKFLINQQGDSLVSVMNLTDKAIKLKAGDILGHACPAEEATCQESENESGPDLPEHLKPC